MKPISLCFSAVFLLAPLAASRPAVAQPDTSKSGDGAGGTAAEAPKDPGADGAAGGAGGTTWATGDAPPAAKSPDEQFGRPEDNPDPPKKDGTVYFLGARFRDFVAPNFLFALFADGGPGAVNIFSGGPELMLRTGALEVAVSVTVPYADGSMNEFLFKSKSDPEQAYEVVSSSLKLIMASVDLMGRIPVDKKGTVAILLGGGVGVMGVVGDLRRTQAYPNDPTSDPGDPTQWNKCRRPSTTENPEGPVTEDGVAYCGNDNDHYPTDTNDNGRIDTDDEDFSEPSWIDGGSLPVVFPYVALPHIAVEVTPIEHFMVRLDTGFSVIGFFFGIGAGGKLPI